TYSNLALISKLHATADTAVVSLAQVMVSDGDQITGVDSVQLRAENARVHTSANADSHLDGFIDESTNATADDVHVVQASVVAADTAKISTASLLVSADDTDQRFYFQTNVHTSLPGGHRYSYARGVADGEIDFNAMVTITPPQAVLVIGPDGTIQQNNG